MSLASPLVLLASVASGALLACWFVSFSWRIDLYGGRWLVRLEKGALGLRQLYGSAPLGCEWQPSVSPDPTCWHPRFETVGLDSAVFVKWWLVIPFWVPVLVSSVATVILFRGVRRKQRKGSCRSCGYDLTGNMSGVCPECGTPIADGRRKA
jgi:hypothetical protein